MCQSPQAYSNSEMMLGRVNQENIISRLHTLYRTERLSALSVYSILQHESDQFRLAR